MQTHVAKENFFQFLYRLKVTNVEHEAVPIKFSDENQLGAYKIKIFLKLDFDSHYSQMKIKYQVRHLLVEF